MSFASPRASIRARCLSNMRRLSAISSRVSRTVCLSSWFRLDASSIKRRAVRRISTSCGIWLRALPRPTDAEAVQPGSPQLQQVVGEGTVTRGVPSRTPQAPTLNRSECHGLEQGYLRNAVARKLASFCDLPAPSGIALRQLCDSKVGLPRSMPLSTGLVRSEARKRIVAPKRIAPALHS